MVITSKFVNEKENRNVHCIDCVIICDTYSLPTKNILRPRDIILEMEDSDTMTDLLVNMSCLYDWYTNCILTIELEFGFDI